MNAIKKAMITKSIKNFADRLDEEALLFIKEITEDPRFDRIMDRVSNGKDVAETVRGELAARLEAKV